MWIAGSAKRRRQDGKPGPASDSIRTGTARGILLAVGRVAGNFSARQLTSAAKRRYSALVRRCFFWRCQLDVSLCIYWSDITTKRSAVILTEPPARPVLFRDGFFRVPI